MTKGGMDTRNKIIEAAMDLALRQGHVATSVDEVISHAGITKGTFFYHFPTKKDLAVALIESFSSNEIRILDENMAKANKLSKDPLQQLLIFISLIQELHVGLKEGQIGCLFASYSYENQLVDENLMGIAADTLNRWKDRLSLKIKEIMTIYPPTFSINPDELADMFLTTLEGAYVLSRVMHRPEIIQSNLEQYKTYLESLFKPR